MVELAVITVTVARGRCCHGRERVRTDTQLRVLDAVACDAVRVEVVDCLGRCGRSDLVLVREDLGGDRLRETWFGGVRYNAQQVALAEWVSRGCADLPCELVGLRIPAPVRPPWAVRAG